ncbi:GNAT family N-acetyltransferase [Paenibacillus sp.]|uniref:GNAT family N-acetyltransferase n=1 Tax=Paenibacillus sp. TaxID=58172 RepID=UPI0025D7B708|nr:GNAT family N-acetyltransferase [Paenibacillus sp.]
MSVQSSMNQIRIVEYDASYAASLADMWNRSNESWGGGTSQRTEATIRQEMENTSNLHVFLAVHDEEVVGFCSFAHYRFDENALYVPLLNVRPDYHGYKIGRNLILKAVEKTVEAGWPRLDLFTWAGNTKAVPMYKKCGFFWEKKDESVHLMNFIPTVLQTEALAPYFETLDWYAHSTRELVIEPDGREENGFDFFDYIWEKEDISLRATFEKTGRGLAALETPDYEIHTEVDHHGLVFGSSYPVRYHIQNKSASDLEIKIEGQDDKNIRFALNTVHTVQPGESITVEGEFHLDPVTEEQDKNKTHPLVRSAWLIDGKRAQFQLGIAPKFPAKITPVLPVKELYPGIPAELILNVENNVDVETEFCMELPAGEVLEWTERTLRFTLPAKGKRAVPVPFTLHTYGIYAQDVEITAVPVGRSEVLFTKKLSVLMKGMEGRYGGEVNGQWIAVNDGYSLHMNKHDNVMWIEYPGSRHSFWWTYPKLGKPYSEELSRKEPKEVKIYAEGNHQVLEAIYELENFPGVLLKTIVKLSASGIAIFSHEVENTSDTTWEEELFLMNNFGFYGNGLILPYQGRFVDMGDDYAGDPGNWDSGQITENWLFCQEEYGTCGIYWDPSLKLIKPEYTLGLQHELGCLEAGAVARTKDTVFALNTFAKWSDFRAYALKQPSTTIPMLDSHLDVTLNGGNLFAPDELQVELAEHKLVPLAGTWELYLQQGGTPEMKARTMEFDQAEHLDSALLKVSPKDAAKATELENVEGTTSEITGEPVQNKVTNRPDKQQSSSAEHPDPLALHDRHENIPGWKIRSVYKGEDRFQERSALWFPQTRSEVKQVIEEGSAESGMLYTVNNGVLSISADPAFVGVVHSLQLQGEEWLDSSYPEPSPRSWWNPWYGGMFVDIPGMNGFSRQLEHTSISWSEQKDQFGNVWKGMRVTTCIDKHEANRGMTVHQHYLMLPGVPVLCTLLAVTNKSGHVRTNYTLTEGRFFKPSDRYTEGWIEQPNQDRFPLGKVDVGLPIRDIFRTGSASRQNMLHAVNHYPNQNAWAFANNLVTGHNVSHELTIKDGETVWTQPTYLVLGRFTLNSADIHDLLKLKFVTTTTIGEASDAHH